tara:strand:+ start:576 stop:887 length:312 start_codon:yes stop_codon:yes gene_type:complete
MIGTDIISAILAINPDAAGKVSVNAEDFEQITWGDGVTPISKEDILAKQTELQAEYNAKQYQRDREVEYPSIKDQLDYIYHNGVTKWKTDMITPVKEKYPKPD